MTVRQVWGRGLATGAPQWGGVGGIWGASLAICLFCLHSLQMESTEQQPIPCLSVLNSQQVNCGVWSTRLENLNLNKTPKCKNFLNSNRLEVFHFQKENVQHILLSFAFVTDYYTFSGSNSMIYSLKVLEVRSPK